MFWADKRVLITGHTGFKGAWLSLWLQRLGARVAGYSIEPPSQPNVFELTDAARGIASYHADVRDLEQLVQCMHAQRPEIVFHLAAQSLVRPGYAQPVETFATNVMGTVNVLEAVRRTGGVRAAVLVTSDKCYDNREWLWGYREVEALGGFDPYSASKGAAEIAAAAYRRSFFHADGPARPTAAVATARAGNVIGGGDWGAERLVPDLVRAFSRREPVLIRSPRALRPWQHVLDALHGYLLLARRLWDDRSFAEPWNFGPADADTRSVAWVADQMVLLWGDGAAWRHDAQQSMHEATLLRLDSSKARSRLGWQGRLDLTSALQWTAYWYKAHCEGKDMRAMTLAQIDNYMSLGGVDE